MSGGRGSEVRAALQFLHNHPDLIRYNAEALWLIQNSLRTLLIVLGWVIFWWSPGRRQAFAGDTLSPLTDGFMRDILEQRVIEEEPVIRARDAEDDPDYHDTDEEE